MDAHLYHFLIQLRLVLGVIECVRETITSLLLHSDLILLFLIFFTESNSVREWGTCSGFSGFTVGSSCYNFKTNDG